MVADGQETLMTAPWVATVPGVAIVLSVLAFSSLADSLNRMLWRGHPRA
jgi:ABC-type dipeptide/oligopeptide/nickel transport system permease subunit